MAIVTVLTPTFNRAHTLSKCYMSLNNQTNKNFEWIIVDDGSEDNTHQLVKTWIEESSIPIKYYYKHNGGKHTAVNHGISYADSDYILILDSDDILLDKAIETVIYYWNKYSSNKDIASVVFLKSYNNNGIVGDLFPYEEFISNPFECRQKYGVKGDKAETFKTSILKDYKYPEIPGEKFIGEGLVWNRIGKKYNSVYINKVIYMCEYLNDGLTSAGRLLRINNPLGGMLIHNEGQVRPASVKSRIKNAIMYTTYGFFAKKKFNNILAESMSKYKTFLLLPISYCVYRYWRNKYKV